MAEYRGLLTQRERDILSGEAESAGDYLYQIRYRVREKIEQFALDLELLDSHHPDLATELREVVLERT